MADINGSAEYVPVDEPPLHYKALQYNVLHYTHRYTNIIVA